MVDWKALAIAFFYNHIRGIVSKFIGGFVGINVDLVLALIGWWKKDTWWGLGLLFGAVTSLGSTMGTGLVSGIVGKVTETEAEKTVTPPMYSILPRGGGYPAWNRPIIM